MEANHGFDGTEAVSPIVCVKSTKVQGMSNKKTADVANACMMHIRSEPLP
ncbi:MAG TPA: hypothetical protein H9778_04210 [Candidatus Parabacteroides intestinavium]|jgi:hypothetical protein|nr:hypothetical protein [Candidatus Parabacteroides intestinavium]